MVSKVFTTALFLTALSHCVGQTTQPAAVSAAEILEWVTAPTAHGLPKWLPTRVQACQDPALRPLLRAAAESPDGGLSAQAKAVMILGWAGTHDDIAWVNDFVAVRPVDPLIARSAIDCVGALRGRKIQGADELFIKYCDPRFWESVYPSSGREEGLATSVELTLYSLTVLYRNSDETLDALLRAAKENIGPDFQRQLFSDTARERFRPGS